MIRTDNASEIDAANAQTVEQTIDLGFVSRFVQAHEEGGFDRIPIGYHSTAPDAWKVAAQVAESTERLHMLVTHRPGYTPQPIARSRAARSRETP
jgi:alkanesulfonate monooxygenase